MIVAVGGEQPVVRIVGSFFAMKAARFACSVSYENHDYTAARLLFCPIQFSVSPPAQVFRLQNIDFARRCWSYTGSTFLSSLSSSSFYSSSACIVSWIATHGEDLCTEKKCTESIKFASVPDAYTCSHA